MSAHARARVPAYMLAIGWASVLRWLGRRPLPSVNILLDVLDVSKRAKRACRKVGGRGRGAYILVAGNERPWPVA